MKPNSTRKRPPKMTPSTIAARLSKLPRFPPERRLLPLETYRYKRVRALPPPARIAGRVGAGRPRRHLLRLRGRVGRAGGAGRVALRVRHEGRRRPARRGVALLQGRLRGA